MYVIIKIQRRRLIGREFGGVRMALDGEPTGVSEERQTASVLVRHTDLGARSALALNPCVVSHYLCTLR